MVNVIFVCLGNICRSPMAEAVFQNLVDQAGLQQQIRVDSAGTGDWHAGEPAHPGTLNILRQHGIAYNGESRQLKVAEIGQYDYVLTMDRSNFSNVLRMIPGAGGATSTRFQFDGRQTEVQMFLHYAHAAGLVDVVEVPDPYYTGGFDYVYGLILVGAQALLEHIRAAHGV